MEQKERKKRNWVYDILSLLVWVVIFCLALFSEHQSVFLIILYLLPSVEFAILAVRKKFPRWRVICWILLMLFTYFVHV